MNSHYNQIKAYSKPCHFELWLICLSINSELLQKSQENLINLGHFHCLKHDPLPKSLSPFSQCYCSITERWRLQKKLLETKDNSSITCLIHCFSIPTSSCNLSQMLIVSCHNLYSRCFTNEWPFCHVIAHLPMLRCSKMLQLYLRAYSPLQMRNGSSQRLNTVLFMPFLTSNQILYRCWHQLTPLK